MPTFYLAARTRGTSAAPPPAPPGMPVAQQASFDLGAASGAAYSSRPAATAPLELPGRGTAFSPDAGARTSAVEAQSGVVATISGAALTVHVPLTSTTPVFVRQGPGEVELCTDVRTLARPGDSPDPQAVYSLLQFGAVVPPLTMLRGIRRLTPGYSHTFDVAAGTCGTRPLLPWSDNRPEALTTEDARLDALATALDAVMTDPRPVILFSGGVDSGLLAARAAALGHSAVLANFSFSPDDPEAAHAAAMARALGLPLTRLTATDGPLDLHALFAELPQPFADHSVIPTVALARAVVAEFGDRTSVLDGTGADAGFGMFGKAGPLRRLYAKPEFFRRAAGAAYGPFGLYRRPGRAERLARLARRSSQLPPLPMTVAQNPLQGIAYAPDPGVRAEVDGALDQWVADTFPDPTGAGPFAPERIAGIDVALTCCAIFAQKAKHIFDASPLAMRYPFLEPAVVRLALQSALHWPDAAEPKAALKTLLSRSVPRDLVYRPKSGFVAPLAAQFAREEILDALAGAAAAASPVSAYLNPRVCRQIRDDLAARRPLPAQTYSFAWAVVVAHVWLSGLSYRRTPADLADTYSAAAR